MREFELTIRHSGLGITVLAFLMAFTGGCASWISDGTPGGGLIDPVQTWALTGVTAAPASVETGVDSALSAAVSNPDGVGLTYSWAGGGGTIVGTGASVTWSHDVAGNFNVSCTVTDGDGNSENATAMVVVTDSTPPPPPGNEAPAFVDDAGDPLTLTGDVTSAVATQTIKFSAMATDPEGDPLTYSWSADGAGTFTDEAVDDDGVASALWAADAAGTYAVTLTADDGQGGVAGVSATIGLTTAAFTVGAMPTEFDYVGFETCQNCHGGITDTWMATGHNGIEDKIQMFGLGRIESCRQCHDVGYQNGGFISIETTPQFKGVQCESCHGPYDGTAGLGHMPVSLDPMLCGACHTDEHHPTYDEWAVSGHATTPRDTYQATNKSCVRCHAGDWYLEIQVHGGDPPVENLDPEVNPGMAIVCATCHDPHDATNANQLRVSSEGTVNLAFEDTAVAAGKGNLCITCHDGKRTLGDRDSHITNGSGHFGPHHNAQGPVLFGVSGVEFAGFDISTDHTHSTIENTCITCHMSAKDFEEQAPAITGHSFIPVFEACAGCHGDVPTVTGMVDTYKAEIDALLAGFVAAWPTDWKDVSDPENPILHNQPVVSDPPDPLTDHDGPAVDDPTGNTYREALWNYLLVLDDGSHGVHNPAYVRDLLNASTDTVVDLNGT